MTGALFQRCRISAARTRTLLQFAGPCLQNNLLLQLRNSNLFPWEGVLPAAEEPSVLLKCMAPSDRCFYSSL